ncbi:CD151 antigen [Eurytemora carolleeae]|uniref:CD151 antigen n=1 Tax=Eurytemora carolleeae TaxID=1294199 RepID=UPI000C77C0C4|nr:CD151 antigen [Eurytemora carolleeae]|eukprot:XP_023336718.1 CD151 antigen-like [Eurytemora affinis]
MVTQGACGASRIVLRWFMRLANILIMAGGITLLAIGIWIIHRKTFSNELLRNMLYLNTARVVSAVGGLTILTSLFGLYAAQKEVKVLHLTYFVLISILLLILSIGAILAYVFTEQVDNTIQAEMISDVRLYDPNDPGPVTWAWDQTQTQLECCGLMTPQVNSSWEIWRYSRALNKGEGVWRVPDSCCSPDQLCGTFSSNISGIFTRDCYVEVKEYVVQHASLLGAVAVGIACIQFLGVLSSLILFRSIV